MTDNIYNFPVALQPVFLGDGKEIKNRKAVVRTDTMDSLGMVSNDYKLVSHASVIDAVREAAKKYDVEEKFTLTNNGANMFYQMTFGKVTIEPNKGDLIQMMLIVKNSYNGLNSLQMIFGAFRLVCLNGMTIATDFMKFQYKHIGEMGGFVEGELVENYKNTLSNYVQLFSEKAPIINQMSKTQIGSTEGLFDQEALKFPKYLVEAAQESYETEKDKSVWGYYNALTFAITHKAKTKNPAGTIWMGEQAWNKATTLAGLQ